MCELGAGKSGLAAIALAIKLGDRIGEILISDGNEEWIEHIQANLKLNEKQISSDSLAKIKIQRIVWDENFTSEEKYDYIVMSDCLFFRDFHGALQNTWKELLVNTSEEGRVFIVGPNRSNTLNEFVTGTIWK